MSGSSLVVVSPSPSMCGSACARITIGGAIIKLRDRVQGLCGGAYVTITIGGAIIKLRDRVQGLCGGAYVTITIGGAIIKLRDRVQGLCGGACQDNHWWWCHQVEGQSVRPAWQVVRQGNHWWWCLQVEGQVIRFTRPQIQSSVDVSPSHSYVFWKTVFLQLSFIFCSIKVNFYNTYGWKECVQINAPPPPELVELYKTVFVPKNILYLKLDNRWLCSSNLNAEKIVTIQKKKKKKKVVICACIVSDMSIRWQSQKHIFTYTFSGCVYVNIAGMCPE